MKEYMVLAEHELKNLIKKGLTEEELEDGDWSYYEKMAQVINTYAEQGWRVVSSVQTTATDIGDWQFVIILERERQVHS